ncbi:MAG: NADH-quinone oxidoreductase subunit L [Desulfuromonadaceae bacterium]|nr:NADH-quinone oxidoreductase subunit L [Desulfuromonadaceae bacterium]
MKPELLCLILFFPLLCGILNALFGMRVPRLVAETLAVCGVASAALLTLLFWPQAAGDGLHATLFTWLDSGPLTIPVELSFDAISAPMALMVSGVSTLIHLYAVGYMKADESYARFFALLNLFVFAMLLIVLADNLLLLFLGWEGVGFCSYGLIGFWYRNPENAAAGRKAFLVTRIGDVFLAVALLWLYQLCGTLSLTAINAQAASFAPATLTALALLLLLGACGKSAQLPLMSWLPDAMAGPTPVSALIHAATMVTAGVYLLCRLFPLISLSPTGLLAIAVVGAATALYAATCALAQREIKRVLAYSTMSQIGYMFLAVGAGSVSGAMFHLFTHAFFKALLFMAAGCIIHLAAEENDIFRMGGVARRAPLIFILFLAGALCLAGFPLSGGFLSKDAILAATLARPEPVYQLLWGVATLTALLTAFYTFRLLYLVFAGSARGPVDNHRLPALMVWPLLPLALFGLGGGLLNWPALLGGSPWLQQRLAASGEFVVHLSHAVESRLWAGGAALFVVGLLAAHLRYRRKTARTETRVARWLRGGWGCDRCFELLLLRPYRGMALFCSAGLDRLLFDETFDGLAQTVRNCGDKLRWLGNGRLTAHLHGFAWGVLILLGCGLLLLIGSH